MIIFIVNRLIVLYSEGQYAFFELYTSMKSTIKVAAHADVLNATT